MGFRACVSLCPPSVTYFRRFGLGGPRFERIGVRQHYVSVMTIVGVQLNVAVPELIDLALIRRSLLLCEADPFLFFQSS